MKIRIKGNHLRFRLRQHDVALTGNIGSIIERIEFGDTTDQQISFSLERCNDACHVLFTPFATSINNPPPSIGQPFIFQVPCPNF